MYKSGALFHDPQAGSSVKGEALGLHQQASSQGYVADRSSPLYSPPEEALLRVHLQLCPQHPCLS